MKLTLFEYECKTCGVFFNVPQISQPYAYGEFLLRKKNSSSVRYLNALASRAYSDVAHELQIHLDTRGLDELTRSDILQAIFGIVACDLGMDGEPFCMRLSPYCAACHSSSSTFWRITDPIEFVEIDVPPVTFSVWNGLSDQDRKIKMMQNLHRYLQTSIVA